MRVGLVRTRLLVGAAMAIAMTVHGVAHAELADEAEQASPADAEDTGEIVVTAEKRETTLQKAPLAITALSPAALDQSNINQLIDMNGFVPGLTVANSGSFVRVVSIRGIGYEASDNLSAQPGTSFHVDGVYIASPYALQQDFLDLQRLEVLRGPQGTVFGQAATGGILNAITVKPTTTDVEGSGEVELGNYNFVRATGTLNVPISDTLAIRGAIQRYKRDGYAQQTGLGAPYGLDDADRISGKATLLWTPTDNFSAQLTAQYFEADEHGAAQKNVNDPDPDPRRISQDYPNQYRLKFFLTYADLRYDFGFATLKSLTSYQRTRNYNQIDVDRLDYKTLGYYDNQPYWNNSVNAISQEFNLSSNGNSRLSYILGAYFLYQKLGQDILEYVGTDQNPTYNLTLPLTFANFPYNLNYALNSSQKRYSYAGFAQAKYELTDRVSATLGLRYNHDKFDSSNSTLFNIYAPTVYASTSENALTGKAEIDFQVTNTNMLYASVSRGFKPGGVSNNSTPLLVPLTYESEKVWAYELGSKNRFFGGKATLNAAAFFYDYRNLQYQMEDPVPYQGGVANVPKTRIWGAEAEGSVQVTPSLTFDGNVTYLDGELIGDYITLDPSRAHQATLDAAALGFGPFDAYTINLRATQVRNTNGNKPPKLPKWQGTIGATHMLQLGSFGSLRTHAEVIYRGKFQYRIFNDGARDIVPHYTQVNANITLKPANSRFTLALTATNLFDEDGIASRYSNPFGSFTTSDMYIPPRQVIGSIKYEF
ncbi:TonB-dependent receptor [Sphingobium terrigena]|uniref:TonB-dependent receptor n=1 Tax=Sphingobium terrigena TaxID=2304063 RepID=A0A418YMN9_9SPHN|nr:TonB-dependent receptor [Sphingobium terrigena]